MSKPFVCTGCRVRIALRPRAAAGHELGSQRRNFSRPSDNDRAETNSRHYGEIQEHRERARRQRIYEDGLSQIGLGRSQPPTGGRYSGQPLKPQQLLRELGESKPPTQRRSPREPTSTRQRVEHPKQPHLRKLFPAVAKFESQIAKSELLEAWKTLRQMRTDMLNGVEVQYSKPFVKKLHQLMRRIVVEYTKELGGSGTGLPTPWDFVQVVKDLNLMSPPLRSELLWRLGNGLAMKIKLDGGVNQEKQARALHEIALMWQDTLETKLRSGSSAREETQIESPLPWSFLPSPHSITTNDDGSHRRLEEVLACIVPTGGYSGGWTDAVGDYQSALFVALDLLGFSTDKSNLGTSTSTFSGYGKPMVVFFNEILERVIKSDVPPALQLKLEQSEGPVLKYYETLVRQFDFTNVPSIRTDRGKSLKDKPRAKLNELGQLVSKQISATSVKKDTQAAGPEGTEDVSVSPPPPMTLDPASLREAGFSVREDWDMDADIHRKVLSWVKRLGRSIETSNLLLAEKCWDEVRKFNAQQSGASSLPLFLYEHFMLAFLALRQPRFALEAWSTVVESGQRPTVKTWTVMMRGCSRANDPDALEKFWARMIEQGVQPDQHAWSVRLFSLVKAKRINKAFSALQKMGQEWIAAVRAQQRAALPVTAGKQHAALPQIDLTQWTGDVGGVPRPSLAIVNSVVSALASKSDEDIPRVLAWARDFAIEFDMTTYNSLLNVAMRHGKTAEALSILKHMEARSMRPNSTTTTVVLAALFKSDYFVNLPAEEQTTKIFSLIAAIEESSPTAKLDVKGYALAIDRMLKEHANPAAARALLEHMSARGLEPTPQIYTILMTSYFDANPPDFAAAEALWNRLHRGNAGYGVALDTIFYDRMVEAYARHHPHVGIAPMMQFLERMSLEGKRPGWPVLELVGRALVDREEWGMLHSLVDDIQNSKGLLRVGVRGLVGQNEFWRFIIGTGIMDRAGVRSEQELRKGVSESSFHGLKSGFRL